MDIQELKNKVIASVQSVLTEVEGELNSLNNQKSNIEIDIRTYRQHLLAIQDQVAITLKEADEAKRSIAEQKAALDVSTVSNKKSVELMIATQGDHQSKVDALVDQQESLKSNISDLHKESIKLQTSLIMKESLDKELKEINDAITAAQAELRKTEDDIENKKAVAAQTTAIVVSTTNENYNRSAAILQDARDQANALLAREKAVQVREDSVAVIAARYKQMFGDKGIQFKL